MPTCDGEHPLVRFTKGKLKRENPLYSEGFVCDKCHKTFVFTPRYNATYHCSQCGYDMCVECYDPKEMFGVIKNDFLSQERRNRFLAICESLQS